MPTHIAHTGWRYLDNSITIIDSALNWHYKRFGDYENILPPNVKEIRLTASVVIEDANGQKDVKINIWNKEDGDDKLAHVLSSHRSSELSEIFYMT